MAYSAYTWANDRAGNTPITADRLNAIEQGLSAAAAIADNAASAAASAASNGTASTALTAANSALTAANSAVSTANAARAAAASIQLPFVLSPAPSGGDDTAALNAWAASCAYGSGVLRPGNYTVTGSILIPQGAKITGYGATLSAAQPGNNFRVLNLANDVHISGIGILTDWAHISTTGIYASGVDGIEIRDVHINRVAGKGIWLDHITNFLIQGCNIENLLEQAIEIDYCSYGRIIGNRINTAQHGIQYWGGDSGSSDYNNGPKTHHLTISDNVVRNGNTDGVTQVSAGIWGSLGQWISITGNVVENWNDFCIDLEGTFDSVVSGNTCNEGKNGILGVNNGSVRCVFDGNTCTNVTWGAPGFRSDWGNTVTYASIDLKITNNYFRTLLAGFTAAYRVANGSSLQRSVFSDNVIDVVGTGTDNLYAGLVFIMCPEMTIERNRLTVARGQSGIRLIGCAQAEVNNNKILMLAASSEAAASGGGISLEYYSSTWKSSYCKVRDNTIRGFGWGIYDKVSSDPGYNLFDGNLVNQIVHNDGGGYKGYNGNNRSEADPTVASGFITSNG